MILDILNDSFIYQTDSDTIIPYVDLVNVPIQAGSKKFRLNFDFNINVASVYVGLSTTSGVTASGYYGNITDLGYPCCHYSFSRCLDFVNENYLDLDFENYGVTPTHGVVCSGMLCSGTSYLKSEPYFLFGCSYTFLLYVKPFDYLSGVTQDNMFFRAEGPNDEILSLGINQYNNLSLMLYNGTSEELYNTGITVVSGIWNLISLRCQPKTKLRVGCNDAFIEVNKPCTFLGGSSVIYLGGAPGVGYFNGVLSDFTWWSACCDNIFIENAISDPFVALNGQRRQVNTTITSSGVSFDLSKNYPSRIYLEFDFPAVNKITGITVNTYDDNYVLASGVDTLFCGTVVRGYTSTDYPISLYNNTDYQTYAYMFAYDSNRYKALSISNDAINYYSNQISLPNDVSFTVGEFNSGVNNEIVINNVYNTKIDCTGAIVLHDNSRKCLWYLSKDNFGFYDLKTGYFYDRTYPYFISETSIVNQKHNWDFDNENNCIYFIYYKTGLYKYNIITDAWSLLQSCSTSNNVCVSISSKYVFYAYYQSPVSEVFRYDLNTGVVDSVVGFNVSSLKIESNNNVLFVFNGNTVFKYDVDTLDVISVSQHIGLENVSEIKDICGYISIVTTSAVYSLSYSQEEWGLLLKVYDFSSSFSISNVNSCVQNIAFVKSNVVYLARLFHYRYTDKDVNIINNYNNTLSLLPLSTPRYKIVWAWLDTEEGVPDFYLMSKFSLSESVIYGFSRDTTPSIGTMSVFMSFNSITKKYTNLSSVVTNNIIDVEHGFLVETYDYVYYINFNKGHYYKYIISIDTWIPISSPKTYSSVSNCTIISAVWDLDKKIYIAGESLGGYVHQNYDEVPDRYYSFFGYINVDTDIIHSLYYLPYSSVVGKSNSGENLSLGGTSFTCDLNYNVINKFLFLAVSQYTSRALSYTFDMTVPTPSGSVDYVFDSLEDLYDYGCIIYNPCTNSRFNNLMNNYYFYTGYYFNVDDSDIPERGSIYACSVSQYYNFRWLGGSVGFKTGYEFSLNFRVKIPDRDTYMPIVLDSPNGGKDGFEVGFDNNDIISCCRKGETSLTLVYPMSSAGVSKGDWVDFGASLSCASGTCINLYINGQNITSSSISTSCSGYNSNSILHFMYTTGSPYKNSTGFYHNGCKGRLTEFTCFNRVLSNQEFFDISYNASGKLIARILMDYNVINESRLPQSSYNTSIPPNPPDYRYDGVKRVYSIYDYISDYIYYLSDYTMIKLDVITSTPQVTNLRKNYNNNCDYNFETQIIKNCFVETTLNTVAGQSVYGLVYIGSNVFDTSTKYYDVGTFVSPVIDVGEIGIIAYNFEYSLTRDAYLEFYIRYANDKPVDFCHIYYIDNTNTFIELSLATGKVFNEFSVNLSKSCDVYYDNDVIKVTVDGSVYNSTNYITPINVFDLTGYTLANVVKTWFSYNGSYILYYTSDKYLVGFPQHLGIPCMRASVVYSSVNHVSWDKYAQRLSVAVDEGVYVYNYMLGEEDYVINAYRIFSIYYGSVVIKNSDSSVLLNKDGVYYNYTVDDIDFSKCIEFDYVTEWMYYVTLGGNLKRMRFVESNSGYELEFLDTGIDKVNDIYKITYDYVILIVDSNLSIYTKNSFIAVSNYPLPYINSGNVVFFDYNPTNKTTYYTLDYLSNNDLVWSDLLDWVPLGSKSSGFVIGKRYVQLKAVFKAGSNRNATPILNRIYFGLPVRVGPILPHSAKDFFVKLNVPLDDQEDIYSVKLIALSEDIVR